MTVEEAIKRSGTRNILAKGSTKKAEQMIQPNEYKRHSSNRRLYKWIY